jgi:hypothetical protein
MFWYSTEVPHRTLNFWLLCEKFDDDVEDTASSRELEI